MEQLHYSSPARPIAFQDILVFNAARLNQLAMSPSCMPGHTGHHELLMISWRSCSAANNDTSHCRWYHTAVVAREYCCQLGVSEGGRILLCLQRLKVFRTECCANSNEVAERESNCVWLESKGYLVNNLGTNLNTMKGVWLANMKRYKNRTSQKN